MTESPASTVGTVTGFVVTILVALGVRVFAGVVLSDPNFPITYLALLGDSGTIGPVRAGTSGVGTISPTNGSRIEWDRALPVVYPISTRLHGIGNEIRHSMISDYILNPESRNENGRISGTCGVT